jgi:hypothetical protein
MKPWLKKAERNLAFRNFSASIIAFAALFERQKKILNPAPGRKPQAYVEKCYYYYFY